MNVAKLCEMKILLKSRSYLQLTKYSFHFQNPKSHLYCKKVGERLQPMRENLEKIELSFGIQPNRIGKVSPSYTRKVKEVIVHEGYKIDGELFDNYFNSLQILQIITWTMTLH